jgi:hypothetical protein
MSLNIVSLIESNPITKFTDNYQSKLIEKIQQHFSNYEQQLFLSSFYCYLKYDPKNDQKMIVLIIKNDHFDHFFDHFLEDKSKKV